MIALLKTAPLGSRLTLESWLERYFALKCLALFVLLSLVKSRALFPQGRFWAEEGAIFYTNICAAPGLSGLGFLFNNHLEFWSNLGVVLAARVPLESAPAVTTFYALALQALPLGLIVAKRQALGLNRMAVIAMIVVAVGMPQSREVWANTINLHFHFALLAALILALPAPGGKGALWSGLLLVACGLSGIPANFLVPLFLLVALLERSPARTLQAALLTSTALLQVWFLLSSGYDGDRNILPPLDVIALSSLTHSFFTLIWSPLSGWVSSELLVPLVQSGTWAQTAVGLGFVVVALILVAGVFGPLDRFRPGQAAGWRNIKLAAAAALLLAASVTLAIGDRESLVSSQYGGRYFFASNMLIALLLLAQEIPARPLRSLAILSLTLFSLIGVLRFYPGPDWGAALAAATQSAPAAETTLSVDIWPHGWQMEIPLACLDPRITP